MATQNRSSELALTPIQRHSRLVSVHESQAKAAYNARDFPLTLLHLNACLNLGGFTEWSEIRMHLLRLHLYRRLGRWGDAALQLEELDERWGGSADPYISNLVLNEREITEGRIVLRSWPSRMTVRLTNRCNIRCIMCSMPREEAWFASKALLDEVAGLVPYLEDIQWQGGEIFVLNRAFLQGLFELGARNAYLGQSIITNGLLIDRRWAEVLVRCGMHIRISVDGASREVYEHIREGARWDGLLKAIDSLREEMERQGRGWPLELHMVVMRANYHEIAAIVEFGHRHGFGTVDLSHMTGEDRPGGNMFRGKDKVLWRAIEAQRKEAARLAALYQIHFADNLPLPPPGLLDDGIAPPEDDTRMNQNASLSAASQSFPLDGARGGLPGPVQGFPPPPLADPDPAIDPLFCLSPWKKIIVRDSGPLITNWHCDRDVGHVQTTSLRQAWNGPEMQTYRRRIIDRTQRNLCTPYCLSGALVDAWRDQIEWNWS